MNNKDENVIKFDFSHKVGYPVLQAYKRCNKIQMSFFTNQHV
jgi:hypothetical protein